ncbi:transcriptional repressor [Phenylobacterium sp.]|uniref:transcriptional repressor n=1 Tax=Phenylobacterium sp. TaxID=1871053 RepID=UPI00391B43D9
MAEHLPPYEGRVWTAPRQRVYRALLEARAAQSAYDLIAGLARSGPHVNPATVYRALDFLMAAGLVHRLETVNSFIACCAPGSSAHAPAFLICDACGRVDERPDGSGSLRPNERAGFQVRALLIEMHGLCPACQTGL